MIYHDDLYFHLVLVLVLNGTHGKNYLPSSHLKAKSNICIKPVYAEVKNHKRPRKNN